MSAARGYAGAILAMQSALNGTIDDTFTAKKAVFALNGTFDGMFSAGALYYGYGRLRIETLRLAS